MSKSQKTNFQEVIHTEDKITKSSENQEPLKAQKKKTLDLIEKDQIENGLGKDELDEELEESVDETTDFSEEKEDSIAPLSKAGTSELDRSAIDERFSKEHEIDEQALRKHKRETNTTPSGS